MATSTSRGQEAFHIQVRSWRLMAYIMYHATKAKRVSSILKHGFKKSTKGMLGEGIYVSRDVQKAMNYGDVIFKLIVYTGKVRRIQSDGQADRYSWQDAYDSAWIPAGTGVGIGLMEETCVKEPWQIRILGVCVGHDQLPSDIRSQVPSVKENSMSSQESDKLKIFKDNIEKRIVNTV